MSQLINVRGGAVSERALLFLVGAVQFVNILDFMMLAPLGPRLAPAIGMLESQIGDATAAYTLAASVAGLIGAFFLERFDRRPVLMFCMLGLALGTAVGGLATGRTTLLAARMFAGLFGGPATAIAIAIVSDVIPQERRGKAMGAVMGAFAAASVVGIPLSLMLAELGNFRTPFFAVAGLGILVVIMASTSLPSLRLHLAAPSSSGPAAPAPSPSFASMLKLLSRPVVVASYAMTLIINAGAFALIPNISTFVQNNLGLPEHQLKYMYFAGGIASFFTTRLTGGLVDRFGTLRIGTIGSVLQAIVIYIGFVNVDILPLHSHITASMYVVFISFMLSSGVRNVAYVTLTTRVPKPQERARFMSLQSSVQHLAAAAGAGISGRILSVNAEHRLLGMPRVAAISILLSAVLPAFMWRVQRRLALSN